MKTPAVAKALRLNRPLAVLSFLCDHCGKSLPFTMVATVGTHKRIAKTYHDSCWQEHIAPTIKLAQEN